VQMNLLKHRWALDRFPVLSAISPLVAGNVVEFYLPLYWWHYVFTEDGP